MGFVENRRALIFRPQGLYVQGKGDIRRGKDWCLGDLGLSEEAWSKSIRGYMAADRLVFFKGEDYGPCLELTREQIDTAWAAQQAFYGTKERVSVYTGVIPGEPGEVWEMLYKYIAETHAWTRAIGEASDVRQ